MGGLKIFFRYWRFRMVFTSWLFITFLWLLIKRLWVYKNEGDAYLLLTILIGFIVVGLGISWTNNVIFWVLIGLSMNKYFTISKNKKYI